MELSGIASQLSVFECEGISSRFERLEYLASLKDEATGRYSHPSLGKMPPADVDSALRQAHMNEFVSWLSMALAEQILDIRQFLAGRSRSTLLQHYGGERGTERLLPSGASMLEISLFENDLSVCLANVQARPGETD